MGSYFLVNVLTVLSLLLAMTNGREIQSKQNSKSSSLRQQTIGDTSLREVISSVSNVDDILNDPQLSKMMGSNKVKTTTKPTDQNRDIKPPVPNGGGCADCDTFNSINPANAILAQVTNVINALNAYLSQVFSRG